MAKNIYQHAIELKSIQIKNGPREEFAQKVIELPYRGYEVEHLTDGRKVVITKPGGKFVFGHPKKDDFLVYLLNPIDSTLWQISHSQIYDDVKEKSEKNPEEAKKLLDLFERVLKGADPDDLLDEINELHFDTGESPEALLKVYKWIWGQEDVNYPTGKGRNMSWEPLAELRNTL